MNLSVFRLILVLLHALWSTAVLIQRLLIFAKQKWEGLLYGKRFKGLSDEMEYVSTEIKVCEKVPSHIVVIIGREDISIKDLTNLAMWSLAAGVSFVSFYDYRGNIKNFKPNLDSALAAAAEIKKAMPKKNGYTNGSTAKSLPHVTLFDITDGKGGIVRVVKQLCKEASAGLLQPEDIKQEYLNELLLKETGVPEPELALYSGDICSTYGFLPWHTRVTEFLPLGSHHNVQVSTFVSLLRRFDKCEQRLGK